MKPAQVLTGVDHDRSEQTRMEGHTPQQAECVNSRTVRLTLHQYSLVQFSSVQFSAVQFSSVQSLHMAGVTSQTSRRAQGIPQQSVQGRFTVQRCQAYTSGPKNALITMDQYG